MRALIPADWYTFHVNAAAYERALGNTRTAEACERDARRAAHLLPVVGTQDADRHGAGGVRAPGFSSASVQIFTHNGSEYPCL